MSFAPLIKSKPSSNYESCGGRLVTADGRALPLTGAALKADAKAGVVRVTLEQSFRNPHDEPLHVTYTLPLPADGAVSGFAFQLGDKRIVGEVDTKKKARQRFEDAILEGRTAALLDQERTSVFTQEVGNVPPRSEVICEVQIDQKLAWLADGCWEWRFPTVVAPRYLGAEGRVADHAKITVDVADQALPIKLALGLSIRDRIAEGSRPESPSHTLHTGRGLGRTDVTLADERGASLDRDVVVRWRVAELKVGTELDTARPTSGPAADAAYGLMTIVPPAAEAKMAAVPRDLIVLLDTSGSMGGEPLDQARRITSALVDSLTDQDQLELIEFSNSPRRWKRGAVKATQSNRKDALAWLARLQASGGTEMRTGIIEALSTLRADAQRQVILVTDGLIGFENEVLMEISKRLPKGSRVHTVGVGSGVNRSLTQPAARAGRGVELVIGLGEDVEVATKRLLARTNAPLITNVEVSGSAVDAVAPARIPDLYGGAPAMVSLKLRASGGTVIVRGLTADGEIEERLEVKPIERGEGSQAVPTLFARETVEDLELSLSFGAQQGEVDRSIERLGLDFQISTRLTSWVAVSAEQTVDPRAPRRQETMPHNLPYGMSAEGVGLRHATAPMPVQAQATVAGGVMMRTRRAATGSFAAIPPAAAAPAPMEKESLKAEDKRAFDDDGFADEGAVGEEAEEAAPRDRDEPALPQRPAAPKPSPAPAKAKQKLSLGELARSIFGGKKDQAPGGAPAPVSSESTVERRKGAAGRRVQGRVVRRANGKLVLEFVITGAPLAWKPAKEAAIELADGSLVKVAVAVEQSTADGSFQPGLTLTVVLEVADSIGEVRAVHLSSDGEVLDIAL